MKTRGKSRAKDGWILRQPRPGDMGWVVHRHGVVYCEEYGWDVQFEGLVADIVAKFIQHHDAKRERCWMAETNGEIIGSVFVLKRSEERRVGKECRLGEWPEHIEEEERQ